MFEIGTTLRDARERRGLSIAECETATRIRAKHLRAMEAERFDLLPEPAFARSFLRTYARHLGVDEDLVLDEYGYRLEPRPLSKEHELAPLPSAGGPLAALRSRLVAPRRPSAGRQIAWLALGGAGAVALLVWAGGVGSDRAAPPVPPDASPAGVATDTTPRVPETVAARPARAGVRLRLAGVGAGSWVRVRRGEGGGPTLFEGTVAAGQARTFRDPRRLVVRVGWAPSLRARLNGRPVPLGAGTVELSVTPRGVRRQAVPEGG